jgi:hypothetical protein
MQRPQSRVLLGFSALYAACILLSAPLARADGVTATVKIVGPAGCGGTTSGSDPAAVNLGPVTCSGTVGNIFSNSASAAGSWVTGEVSVSATVSYTNGSAIPSASGVVDLTNTGTVSLAPGMTSVQAMFGVNGITASATGSGAGTGANASSVVDLTFTDLTTGASVFTGACVGTPPPTPCLAVPGALPPLTLTVSNGDTIQLSVHVIAEGFLCCSGTTASTSVTVDPLFLDLPAGATYDSGIADFLSGPAPTQAPEPSSVLLLLSGLAALVCAARFGRCQSRGPELQVRA